MSINDWRSFSINNCLDTFPLVCSFYLLFSSSVTFFIGGGGSPLIVLVCALRTFIYLATGKDLCLRMLPDENEDPGSWDSVRIDTCLWLGHGKNQESD